MGTNTDRKYAVLNKAEYDSMVLDYSKLQESGANTVRWNNNEDEFFVSYIGTKPSFLKETTEIIDHASILELMQTAAWIPDDEDEM